MSDVTLTPADLARLRAHVVFTADGRLGDEPSPKPKTVDEFRTTAADIVAIVEEHLDAFVTAQQKKMPKGSTAPVPVLIWAHGGLTTKEQGMATAHRQASWWLANGVFPIHAVWESGFWTTLQDVLGIAPEGERGISDLTDIAVEAAARLLGGRKFWDDMKVDAMAASLGPGDGTPAGGGGYVLAAALRDYMQRNPDRITLHIAGHSAGSIYHSAFVPLLLDADDAVPSVATVTFLAPAVRIDTFEQSLLPWARKGRIEDLSIFTMDSDHEKRDNTAGVYRKSLLWLVSHAFEVEREARILGLQEHLDAAAPTMAYLRQKSERLVLGPVTAGRRTSSGATSHGDFDNDVATMNSLARRVVGTRATDAADDLAEKFGAAAREGFPTPGPEPVASRDATPRKRALCIGIDTYSKKPLTGCVADAKLWATTFADLGFAVTPLHNEKATRDAMLRAMLQLVTTSAAGDVVAIQYSGHGTAVPDLDHDETDAIGNGDEGLCPYDFFEGQLVLDDDLGIIWDAIPEGVSVSLFFDSCHSGTANRDLDDAPPMKVPVDAVARTLDLDADERELFRKARSAPAKDAMRRRARAAVVDAEAGRALESGSRAVREVLFSACQPEQVALETGGHGVFTSDATKILAANPQATNREFHAAVREAMAKLWEQKPAFEPGVGLADLPLLSSVGAATPVAVPLGVGVPLDLPRIAEPGVRTAAIVAILRATADLLEAGGAD